MPRKYEFEKKNFQLFFNLDDEIGFEKVTASQTNLVLNLLKVKQNKKY